MMIPIAALVAVLFAVPVRAELDDATPESIAELAESHAQLSGDSSKLQEFRAARKEYRAWLKQGDNRERAARLIKDFKAAVRAARRERNPEAFNRELSSSNAAGFRCSVQPLNEWWVTQGGWVFLAGNTGFPCRDFIAPRTVEVDVRSYGLGVSIMPRVEAGGIACTGPQRADWMVGVNLEAGFIGFASSGLYFGRGGVCGLLVAGPGYGGGVGLSILNFD